jgi:hypothetical protein
MKLYRALLWTLSWASLAVSLPAVASAGTVITLKEQSPQGSSDHKVYLDGGKLRIESGGSRRHVILYHAVNGTVQILDPAKKTFFEMPAGNAGAAQQAAAAKKVMERTDLSPARKQLILKNMKENSERHGLYGGPPVAAQYKKVASGVQVNGYTTDEYDIVIGGMKMREVWLADPKSLGIDPADAVAFKAMAERLGATSVSTTGPGGRQSSFGLEAGAPQGVPVRSIGYVNGQKTTITDLAAVSHEDVSASLFEVPKDFKQVNPGAPAAN